MKRGAPKHPKIFRLCSLLKCKRPTAIGLLEMLWHATAEYTPQGDIGKYDDAWIEAALDWTGRKGHLINCLVEAGWLDHEPATTKEFVGNDEGIRQQWPGNRKLFVHHWHDHADSVVHKRLERLHLPFLTVREKVTGQSTVTDQFSAASRARDPIPSLPIPSLPVQADHPPTPSEASGLCASDDARGENSLAKTPRSGGGYRPEWFPAFWKLYPRKVAKLAAEKAFKKHVTSEEIFQQVVRGLEAQMPKLTRDLNFCPYPASWLNGARWLDPVESPSPPGKPAAREDRSLEASVMRVIGPRLAKGEKPW